MYSLEYEGNQTSDKRLDSYLKNEKSHKRTMIIESDIGTETGTRWSLIETKSAKNRETEKGNAKGNVGNPPLSRISNNPDTNPVS